MLYWCWLRHQIPILKPHKQTLTNHMKKQARSENSDRAFLCLFLFDKPSEIEWNCLVGLKIEAILDSELHARLIRSKDLIFCLKRPVNHCSLLVEKVIHTNRNSGAFILSQVNVGVQVQTMI
jgi:hypothetical protein